MTPPARVGRTAFVLGFAGLLPQVLALGIALFGSPVFQLFPGDLPVVVWVPFLALAYASLILSFLGGAWWGLAMGEPTRQPVLLPLAVVPSLVALAIDAPTGPLPAEQTRLMLMGAAIVLTLPVDWLLVRMGIAPRNWMWLRVPLSIGLGTLTFLIGLLTVEPLLKP